MTSELLRYVPLTFWDALKCFILNSLNFKVAPYPIIVSLDTLNAEKLKYKSQEVKFVGYILSAKGHTADPEKIRATTEMEHPTNVSELRWFCGMVNYLAKYVQGLATLMEPLHQLTRKDSLWEWMPEHSIAFDRIKDSLVSAPSLIF